MMRLMLLALAAYAGDDLGGDGHRTANVDVGVAHVLHRVKLAPERRQRPRLRRSQQRLAVVSVDAHRLNGRYVDAP